MMKKSVKTEPLVYKWKHKQKIWLILQDTGLHCVFKPTKTRKETEKVLAKRRVVNSKKMGFFAIYLEERKLINYTVKEKCYSGFN